jgi:hypothetical protein
MTHTIGDFSSLIEVGIAINLSFVFIRQIHDHLREKIERNLVEGSPELFLRAADSENDTLGDGARARLNTARTVTMIVVDWLKKFLIFLSYVSSFILLYALTYGAYYPNFELNTLNLIVLLTAVYSSFISTVIMYIIGLIGTLWIKVIQFFYRSFRQSAQISVTEAVDNLE